MTISPSLPQNPLNQPRTVSSPAGLTSQNGIDGFRPSQDLLDRQGQMGAAMLAQGIAGSHYDGILRAQAQQLMVAATSGAANAQSLAEQLMKDYQKARENGATLSPETEELVRKALEMVQGGQQQQPQDGGGGGTPQVGGASPAGNGGGASGGSSPSRSSSGPRQTGNGNSSNGAGPSNGPRNTNSSSPSTPSPSTPENPEAAAVERVHDQVAQGTPENCSATAIIKAMQHQWGDNAMKMETLPSGNVRVTMRDGYSAELTPDQIRQAREASDYSGSNPAAVEQAARMNAAAAQRYARENGVPYEQALQHINTRQFPDEIARYFGVAAQSVDPRTLDGHGFGIVYNGEHAANVMRGPRGQLYQDDHGRIPRGPNGRRQPYDGNVISNGQNTGPATRGLVIRDVNPQGQSQQVPGLSRQEWRGYVGERARPASSGGGTGQQAPRPATSSGSGSSARSTTRGTRAPGGSRGGGSTTTVAKNTTRTTRKSSTS